jgi:hypothetical protein
MLGLLRSSHGSSAAISPPRWSSPRHGSGTVNRVPSDYLGRHAARTGLWVRLSRRRIARRHDFVPLQRIA